MTRLKYILVLVAFGTVFSAARSDLEGIRIATDKRMAATSRLEDVSRLETETYRFLDTAGRLASQTADSKKEDVEISFDILWSRVEALRTVPSYRSLQPLQNEQQELDRFANALRDVEPYLRDFQAGDTEIFRKIAAKVEPSLPLTTRLAQNAFKRRVDRSIQYLQTQKAAAESVGRLQVECALIGLIAIVMVIMELAKVRKLNLELRARDNEISELAIKDSLTGLHNRRSFDDHVNQLEKSQSTSWHLLLIDLDGFKGINDYFGHAAGDHLLHEISARFRKLAGSDTMIARLGGDEFAMVSSKGESHAIAIAARLLSEVRQPVNFGEETLCIAASIGIAGSGRVDSGETADAVYHRADLALYAAKKAGKNQFKVYDPSMARCRQESIATDSTNALTQPHRQIAVNY